MNTKHTINIALSLSGIKRIILAECAWIDATNITTLPPIINPIKKQDIENMILSSITAFCTRFSGYITSTTQDEDIYHIEMNFMLSCSNVERNLIHLTEEFIICHFFTNAYAPQKQAQHITSLYSERLTTTIRSISHALALYTV